jgi:hypothetical protein
MEGKNVKAIYVGDKKLKAVWVGVENEPMKIWENGVVLNEEIFARFASMLKGVSLNG